MPAKRAKTAARKPAKRPTARRPAKAAKKAAKGPSTRARPATAAKADGDAPVRAYIASLPGWQRAAAQRFDALVSREAPAARRAVKWSAAFYGVPGQGWFASVKGFSKVLKMTFFRGTSLEPVPPSGEHEAGRALDVREGDAIDEAQLASWIRQAAALPGWGNS